MGSTVGRFTSSAMAQPEADASAALGKAFDSPRDAYRDPARPFGGFTRPAATIRICDNEGNTFRVIVVPAIPAERLEFDHFESEAPQ